MVTPEERVQLLRDRRPLTPQTELELRTSEPLVFAKPGTPVLPESLETVREAKTQELSSLAERLKLLNEQIPEAIGELAAVPTRAGFTPGDPNPIGSLLAALIPRRSTTFEERLAEGVFGETEEFREKEAAFNLIAGEIIELSEEVYWTRWQSNIITALPIFVQANPNITAEDIFAQTQYGERVITPEARRFIDGALNEIRIGLEVKEEAGREAITILERPGGSLQDLLAINPAMLSSEQIVKDIIAAGRFSLPDSISTQDIRGMLADMGLSDAEIDEEMFDASAEAFRLSEDLRQWDAQQQALLTEGRRILGGEIQSRIRKAQWARAATQPGLLLLRPVTFWMGTFIQGNAGFARGLFLRGTSRLKQTITFADPTRSPTVRLEWHGNSKELQEYNAVIEKAKAEGANTWQAYKYAHEEWDTNWLNKFLVEIAVDPFTYLGFGLYTKLASPIPKLGAGVGLFEKGFTRAMELPFDALKSVWMNAAPRTITFAGKRQARATWDLLQQGVSQAHNRDRVTSIRFTTPDELRDYAFLAINEAIDNPAGIDETTRVGRALLGSKGISEKEVLDLIKNLGVDLEVNPSLLERINFANEITKQQHGISAFLTRDESAPYITQKILGLSGTEDQLRIVGGFLDAVKRRLIREAQAPFQTGTTKQMSLAMVDHVRDTFVAAQRTTIANKRIQHGLVRQALHAVPTATARAWMQTVDKYLTVPMAKAYLMFGFYGPMNVLESAIKTMLATNSVRSAFFRGGGARETQQLGILLTGIDESVPINILFPTDFNVGLALPEDQWRTLASPRSTTSERNIARKIVTKYTNAVNEGMLLRTLGNDLKTGTLYNWGNRVSGAQLSHYQKVMFKRQLTEREPNLVEALGKAVKEETLNLETAMSKEVAQSYREAIFNALSTGNRRVLESTPDVFTPGRVHAGEVARELDTFELITPDMKQMVVSAAESGEIFRTGGLSTFRSMLREASYERYFTSPEVFERTYGDIVEAILESVPRTRDEINAKVNMLDSMIEVFHNTVSNTLDSAVSYSRSLKDSRQTTEFFNSLWGDRLSPSISRISLGLENAIEGMKAQLSVQEVFDNAFVNLAPSERAGLQNQYSNLLDNILKRNEVYRRAREEYQVVRQEFFSPGGVNFVAEKTRDNAFWNSFFASSKQPWDDARNILTQLEPELLAAKAQLADVGIPIAPNLADQGVRKIDIARLWGIPTGDLDRSMFLVDSMSIWNEGDFVAKTMARAELSARATGKTAEQIGWNQEAVSRLYREMTLKYRSNPDVVTGVEPLMHQVDEAMLKVHAVGMRRNALMSDEGQQLVREAVDRLGNRAYGRSGIMGPAENIDFELVSKATPRPAQLALPSAERGIAADVKLLDNVTTAVRTHAEGQQELVNTFKSDVQTSTTRRANRFSNRLVKLGDSGVDIRQADLELENFITASQLGNSAAARQAKNDAWDSFVQSLNSLDIDIGGSVRAAQDKVKQGFIPGTPGAPGRVPVLSIRTEERKLKEAINARRSAQRRLRRADRDEVASVQATLDSSQAAIISARSSLREAREGVSSRLQRGRRVAGARREAAERLERFSVQEEPLTGGPVQTFDRIRTRFFVGEQGLDTDAQLRKLATPEYQAVRRDALAETNRRRGLDFPDYENETAFGAVMKTIYPFWAYESHRWAWWLPREALRHPGVWASWGKYVDNTDGGYLHIPGTSIDVNPLRGTILMGGMRRLFMRDFPEYYDNFEGVAEVLDVGSRWGFYPGFPVGATMAVFGATAGKPQIGELLPASAKTVLASIMAISPKKGQLLTDVVFPDRFRDYLIALEVSRLEFDKPDGMLGPDILRKRLLGEKLLPEEEAVWLRATRGIGHWQVLFEQTGVFRFNPEERRQVRRLAQEIIEEFTGVAIEDQEDIRRTGLQIEEITGPFGPDLLEALKVLDQWRRFTGASIALLPSQEGLVRASIAEFWKLVTTSAEAEKDQLLVVEQEFINNPTRGTMGAWLTALNDKIISTNQLVNKLRGRDEDGEVLSENVYTHLPVTLQERRVAAEESGLKVFYSPLEEMRELYYQRPLTEVFDEELGRTVKDFDTYYLNRQVIEDALGDDARSRLLEFTQRNDTPVENVLYKVSQDFLRPYNNIRDGVMAEFSEEDRSIIRRARELNARERAELRSETTVVDGQQVFVVSEFDKRVRTARGNLREADPELDAWLVFFNRATVVKTPAAQNLLDELYRKLQEQAVLSKS